MAAVVEACSPRPAPPPGFWWADPLNGLSFECSLARISGSTYGIHPKGGRGGVVKNFALPLLIRLKKNPTYNVLWDDTQHTLFCFPPLLPPKGGEGCSRDRQKPPSSPSCLHLPIPDAKGKWVGGLRVAFTPHIHPPPPPFHFSLIFQACR